MRYISQNNLYDVYYNHHCGLVMCRFKNYITIAHKNVVQHLVQCRASDWVPFKSRERNHDYGHKGTVAEWFNAIAC